MTPAAAAPMHIPAYEVLDFKPDTGQLVIRFKGLDGRLAIDLPVENGRYPVGRELDVYVAGFLPQGALERASALRAGVSNAHELEALVVKRAATPSQAPAPDWF